MSVIEASVPWGPPWSMRFVSWYGVWHTPGWVGSGEHTVGLPFASIGMPSAPGNVPK